MNHPNEFRGEFDINDHYYQTDLIGPNDESVGTGDSSNVSVDNIEHANAAPGSNVVPSVILTNDLGNKMAIKCTARDMPYQYHHIYDMVDYVDDALVLPDEQHNWMERSSVEPRVYRITEPGNEPPLSMFVTDDAATVNITGQPMPRLIDQDTGVALPQSTSDDDDDSSNTTATATGTVEFYAGNFDVEVDHLASESEPEGVDGQELRSAHG